MTNLDMGYESGHLPRKNSHRGRPPPSGMYVAEIVSTTTGAEERARYIHSVVPPKLVCISLVTVYKSIINRRSDY